MKGEFENRLRQVIDEVQSSPKPIILFIDEAHTLIGAGGAAGTGDAANLLKPALARGTLRTIAATTWAEYKKYIEKDPALTRRFQVVQVAGADRGQGAAHDARHGLDAGEAPPRAGPRRGAGGGGEALAPLHSGPPAAGQGGEPARHGLRARGHQPARRPGRGGGQPPPDRGARDRARHHRARAGRRLGRRRARTPAREPSWTREKTRLAGLEERWKTEKGLVDQILELRETLRGGTEPVDGTASKLEKAAASPDKAAAQTGAIAKVAPADAAERPALLEKLRGLQDELAKLQGETPLDPADRRRRRRWRRWSATGPASPSAAWSRTRSRPS